MPSNCHRSLALGGPMPGQDSLEQVDPELIEKHRVKWRSAGTNPWREEQNRSHTCRSARICGRRNSRWGGRLRASILLACSAQHASTRNSRIPLLVAWRFKVLGQVCCTRRVRYRGGCLLDETSTGISRSRDLNRPEIWTAFPKNNRGAAQVTAGGVEEIGCKERRVGESGWGESALAEGALTGR